MDSQFVERDPRRGGFAGISYLVDQSDGVALAFVNPTGTASVPLPNAVTEARLDASMLHWQNSPLCPGPGVVKLPDPGADPDVVDGLVFEDPARIGTPSADITIDSVVTHESGHAFGLGHFGKVFIDTKGVIEFAPRAVMNAVYVSRFTELAGTDNASFCSIWANGK